MPCFLKQSTAVDIAIGPFLDDTDGKTAETALTISQADVRLKKNNGAWAQVNDNTAATHEENGWYEKELDATDTNTLGILIVAVHESGALPVWREFMVVPANVYDGLVSGTGVGPRVDVQGWLGTAPATPTTAGVPEVDVTHWRGDAVPATTISGVPEVDATHLAGSSQSLLDLQDFADAGYDPVTNKVQGVVLVDTATNLTNLPAITANWLTATGINNDAFTAAKFAADVTTEFQNGLATAASISALNNLSQAQAQTAAEAALVTHRLDELLNADSDIDGAAPPTVGSVFHELMSKTTGSFTYDQTTDSNEAIRDRGDAAWITATGFSTLTQGDIRTAVGLASANLDTQLGDLPTNAELTTSQAAADDATLAAIAALNNLSSAQAQTAAAAALTAYDPPTNAEMEARTRVAAEYALETSLTALQADHPNRITKNVALSGFTFPMVLASDHVTGATGKTVTATRSIDGAAFAACANSVTEISNGWYKIDLAAADLNGNTIALRFTATACDDRNVTIVTQPT